MAVVNGTSGNDFIHRAGDGQIPPGGANDIPLTTAAADTITGGLGDDTIFGDDGADSVNLNVTTDGADSVNGGLGADVINVTADTATNVRLTFTSAEVGNGVVDDSNTMANQDGELAVRMQAETAGTPAGPVTRTDDEGVTFVGGAGVTFDVRDLVSGAARGEAFKVVTLGTSGADTLTAVLSTRSYYFNGGGGADTITDGTANDFLVGGGGDDTLTATVGNDTFIGGGGSDAIAGGIGADNAIFNVTTDGTDTVDLGADSDTMTVNATAPTNVRLTFTSAEVGNGNPLDSNSMANQDGGLAVRLQAEDGSGALVGGVTRVDDEGINFIGGAGVTFDVRDLVSGAARGESFRTVALGTSGGDLIAPGGAEPVYVNGGGGNDTVTDGTADDFLVGGGGDDTLTATLGNDSFIGGGGNDQIVGGSGNDVATVNVLTDGADAIDLGGELDVVNVNTNAMATTNVRLTFTSSEVGNGNPNDSNTMANQDGGLAVRMQAEDGSGVPTGPVTRVEDEGITFVGGAGVTFDVRDLVSGAARGEAFEVVTLGTSAGDTLGAVQSARPYYINGGGGADTITDGSANDFLVGGGGDDTLTATLGNDSFIGGGGNDQITGGGGTDVATVNVLTDGADAIDLGGELDVVNVNTNAMATTNVRLTFTSSEVGNGNPNDSNTMANQDGGLAVRMQAEDGSGVPTGPVTRVEDEGITFVGGAGVTFDVRDLVSGAARGEAFEVVTLGTSGADALLAVQSARPYYINGGGGNDLIADGTANDFLVGGGGDDTLLASLGDDSFIGGAGNDSIRGRSGREVATMNVLTDGADAIDLGAGFDVVNVNTNALTTTNVRLTFTSAEVGNGVVTDSGALANQDGGLAVRMQAETAGTPAGPLTRTDDEGITFVGGAGVTFDVRDLVSGAARGEAFEVVTLGSAGSETLTALQSARPYYINGGAASDTIIGGSARDFLVGGTGVDSLVGGADNDTYIVDNAGDRVIEAAGGGADTVLTSVSYGLLGNQEVETLTTTNAAGTAAINLAGNELANIIQGNAGNNGLSGRAGADTMTGFAGDDIYLIDNAGDRVIEAVGGGADTVQAGVSYVLQVGQAIEALNTEDTSTTDAINLTGNEFSQTIRGNAGDNVLAGRAGADLLFGFGGADTFSFNTSLGASNIDHIDDFSAADDTIRLDQDVFTALPTGALAAAAFKDLSLGAQDADDLVLYNKTTGALFYDGDGLGGAGPIQFATLDSKPTITNADFVVVA